MSGTIFLGIHGVLNSARYFAESRAARMARFAVGDLAADFDPLAIERLQTIVTLVEPTFVITSRLRLHHSLLEIRDAIRRRTWRIDDGTSKPRIGRFTEVHRIVDRTRYVAHRRIEEIDLYRRANDVGDRFVVVDSDPAVARHFGDAGVYVDRADGLLDEHVEAIVARLAG